MTGSSVRTQERRAGGDPAEQLARRVLVADISKQQFTQAFLDGVDAGAPGAPPFEVVAPALRSVGAFFGEERRGFARARARR